MAERLPRTDAATPLSEITDGLQEFGAIIVDGLLDSDVLARFNAEIDDFLSSADPKRKLVNNMITGFMGEHTRHITGVASKSRTFVDDVLCHPVLIGVCDEILLPACSRYQLNIAHVLERGPGSVQQFLHRDELVWCHVPTPHPELQVASVIALVPFSSDNGATRVIPGSHRWSRDRQPQLDELVAAEMPAGAGIIYLGSTIHGGGPNTTQSFRRRGMHMSYTLGWLRTEENNYLATPPEIARALPRQAQEMLGYAAHDAIAEGGGYLGVVDTRDPVEMLETGEL